MTVVLIGCRSGLVWMSRCFGKGGECHLGVELHVFAMARDFHVEGSEWKSFVLLASLLASLADLRPKIVVLHCSTLRVSVAPCVSLHHRYRSSSVSRASKGNEYRSFDIVDTCGYESLCVVVSAASTCRSHHRASERALHYTRNTRDDLGCRTCSWSLLPKTPSSHRSLLEEPHIWRRSTLDHPNCDGTRWFDV
jgi:hypothetical protein